MLEKYTYKLMLCVIGMRDQPLKTTPKHSLAEHCTLLALEEHLNHPSMDIVAVPLLSLIFTKNAHKYAGHAACTNQLCPKCNAVCWPPTITRFTHT